MLSSQIIMRNYWPTVIITIVFFLLTAYSYSYTEAITKGYSDIEAYIAIARIADIDGLYPLSSIYLWHHLERWPINFLLGILANNLDIDIWSVYRAAVLICMAITAFTIGCLRCDVHRKLAFFMLVLLNPYTFRIYYGVPGMIADCLFYTAIVGVSVGMFNRNSLMIVLFTTLASLSRQTSILLMPVLLIFCVHERVGILKTTVIIGSLAASFLVTQASAKLLFQPVESAYLMMHTLGIFFWIVEDPDWLELFHFLGRYGLMWLTLLPALVVAGRNLKQTWVYLLFFIILQTQPFLAGPVITGSNIDRLAIYGLPFLCLIFLNGQFNPKYLFIFAVLLFATSLQPQFTFLHYIAEGRYIFVSTILLSAFISIRYFYLQDKHAI
jgi:hypothetical protein